MICQLTRTGGASGGSSRSRPGRKSLSVQFQDINVAKPNQTRANLFVCNSLKTSRLQTAQMLISFAILRHSRREPLKSKLDNSDANKNNKQQSFEHRCIVRHFVGEGVRTCNIFQAGAGVGPTMKFCQRE